MKQTDANVMALGTVAVAPANVGLNLDDKG
jgi:hypothetical protein